MVSFRRRSRRVGCLVLLPVARVVRQGASAWLTRPAETGHGQPVLGLVPGSIVSPVSAGPVTEENVNSRPGLAWKEIS